MYKPPLTCYKVQLSLCHLMRWLVRLAKELAKADFRDCNCNRTVKSVFNYAGPLVKKSPEFCEQEPTYPYIECWGQELKIK